MAFKNTHIRKTSSVFIDVAIFSFLIERTYQKVRIKGERDTLLARLNQNG